MSILKTHKECIFALEYLGNNCVELIMHKMKNKIIFGLVKLRFHFTPRTFRTTLADDSCWLILRAYDTEYASRESLKNYCSSRATVVYSFPRRFWTCTIEVERYEYLYRNIYCFYLIEYFFFFIKAIFTFETGKNSDVLWPNYCFRIFQPRSIPSSHISFTFNLFNHYQ